MYYALIRDTSRVPLNMSITTLKINRGNFNTYVTHIIYFNVIIESIIIDKECLR